MTSSLASPAVLHRQEPPARETDPDRNPKHVGELRAAGALMIAGAVLVTIGFVLLGSRFDYPDVLEEPAAEILLRFHADPLVIGALFAGLAGASGLLIPIAWFGRHLIATDRRRTGRLMVAAGIGAGIVQVVGLLRWPLLVPHLADLVADPATSAAVKADAIDTFQTLHTYLGGVVGEAFGYALTAIWTLAIVAGVARRPGRWFGPLGIGSALLITAGLLEPLGVPGAGFANFVGYNVWSIWMIGFGIWLLRLAKADIATSRAAVAAARRAPRRPRPRLAPGHANRAAPHPGRGRGHHRGRHP